ncbi:MAG: hypothetical protein Q8L47_01515 [bacterium]|nr:hypothetical protein [bacterium]
MTVFKKKLLINVGLILVVLLFVSGSLYYIIGKFNSINSEILYYKERVHAAQQEIKEYSSLKGDNIKAASALSIIRKAIPLYDDLFMFRADMEKLARIRSLSSGFSFGAEVPSGESTLGYINFNMSPEGDLKSVLTFIKDIESSSYLLELNQVSVRGSGNNSTGRLDGKIFFVEELKKSADLLHN